MAHTVAELTVVTGSGVENATVITDCCIELADQPPALANKILTKVVWLLQLEPNLQVVILLDVAIEAR